MSTATQEEPTTTEQQKAEDQALTTRTGALPEAVVRRGMSEGQWRMLFNLFPGARPDSALMVWDYCKARGLDPMKKPCHIVPMRVKDAQGNWGWRDVVMPGIYEYRITAHRTKTYLGHSKPEFGPVKKFAGVDAPEYCEMTFYRWHNEAQRTIEFPVRVFFSEVVATKQDGNANDRWSKAPIQMLTKCTEAAGLREAWPEEFGGEPTFEELEGQRAAESAHADAPREPVRRSEKAAVDAPVVTSEPTSDAPVLKTELPDAGQKAGAVASGSNNGTPRQAGSGSTSRAAATAKRPEAAKVPAGASGPSVVTEHLVFSESALVQPREGEPYYELSAIVQKQGQAPVAFKFRTTDEALYKTAESCEGTDTRFRVRWHSVAGDGKGYKALESIEAMD